MLRRMKGLFTALAVILSVGLGSPAFATGIVDRDDFFFDREDLAEELILRDRLFGPPFGRPFGVNPFLVNPFLVNPFLVNPFDFEEELFEFEEFGEERFEFEDD